MHNEMEGFLGPVGSFSLFFFVWLAEWVFFEWQGKLWENSSSGSYRRKPNNDSNLLQFLGENRSGSLDLRGGAIFTLISLQSGVKK